MGTTTPKRGFSEVPNGFPGPAAKRAAVNLADYDISPTLSGAVGPRATDRRLMGMRENPSIDMMGQMITTGGDDRNNPVGVARLASDAQSIPDLPEDTVFTRGEMLFNLRLPKRTVLSLSMLNYLFEVAHAQRVMALDRLVVGLGAENALPPDRITFDEKNESRHPYDKSLISWLQSLQTAEHVLANIYPVGFYEGNTNTTFKGANLLNDPKPHAYDSTITYHYFGDLESIVNNCNAQPGMYVFLKLIRDHPKREGEPLRLKENYGPWKFVMVASRQSTLRAVDFSTDVLAAVNQYDHVRKPLQTAGEMVAATIGSDPAFKEKPLAWVDRRRRAFDHPDAVRITDLRFRFTRDSKLIVKEVSDAPTYFRLGVVQLEENYVQSAMPSERLRLLHTDPTGRHHREWGTTMRLDFNLQRME